MKKKEVQKLTLSRETLRELKSPDAQKAVRGALSTPTLCTFVTTESPTDDGCGLCNQ
jgi:hypothetical protein